MKCVQLVFLFVLVLNEISFVFTSNNAERNSGSSDLIKPDNNTVCTNDKKCIMKCCPFGKYLSTVLVKVEGRKRKRKLRVCDYYNEHKNLTSFEKDGFDLFIHPNMSMYEVKAGVFMENDMFKRKSVDVLNLTEFNVYLTEDAEVHLEMPNAYERWRHIKNDKFCWEYLIVKNEELNTSTTKPGIWVHFDADKEEPSRTNTNLMTTAMLISCFFLLVVLVVYGLLPELRNLCGMILMAYVASLFVAFLLLAVMRMDQHHVDVCLHLTFFIYFFFLASFCWMNVMSYDIWWTFRGYAKARPIHRRGENFKFLMYCLYAWGLPLAMTIGLNRLNNYDMSHIPWFVTPKIPTNGCFIEEGEKYLYLYMPMMILIMSNWMFYLMTAFNIWRLSRGTAVLDSAAAGTPQAHRTQRHRLMVYLKLSVVMGLNWVLEVVSYKCPNDYLWVISDFYNILIGVSIFLIFVCKPKILKKLTKVYLRCKKSHWRPGKMNSTRSGSSTSDSNTSQETQTLQVCANPKGLIYNNKNSF